MTVFSCHTFTLSHCIHTLCPRRPSSSTPIHIQILINLLSHSSFPTHSHSHIHTDTKCLGGPPDRWGEGFRGVPLNKWHPGLVWCCQGLNWSPGLQRLLSASVSQWQQVCRAGSKLVQAWDPYLMNDSLANGPPFTGFHCRAISRFLSYPTQKKPCPALLVLLGLIGLGFWNVLVFVWFCMCELWSRAEWYLCIWVCWWCSAEEGGWGVHFCTFLLVKLMGAVVSRQGPWNDVKLSVTGPNHSVWFSFIWMALPGRSVGFFFLFFSLSEVNTMCAIFTAYHKFRYTVMRLSHSYNNTSFLVSSAPA